MRGVWFDVGGFIFVYTFEHDLCYVGWTWWHSEGVHMIDLIVRS